MPIINNGRWEAPFWGAPKKIITGQDMLGMQNTSIATYATLLPGVTNLTRRIRYYGFYMWLLEQYAKTKGKVSVSEFHRFMRRGELILAFVMIHSHTEELGVVGSLYARNRLQKNIDPIDIAAGADRENDGIYWQYSSGAFGQYYQGALSSIGLIAPSESESRILVYTPDYGRKLAGLFENTIDETTREKYLTAIDRGIVLETNYQPSARNSHLPQSNHIRRNGNSISRCSLERTIPQSICQMGTPLLGWKQYFSIWNTLATSSNLKVPVLFREVFIIGSGT